MDTSGVIDKAQGVIAGLSQDLTSGGADATALYIILACGLVACLVILLALFRANGNRQILAELEPLRGVNGRLEKLEQTLNAFKSEVSRAQLIAKADLEYIKTDLKHRATADASIVDTEPEPEPLSIFEPEPSQEIPTEEAKKKSELEEPASPSVETLTTRLTKTRKGFFERVLSVFSRQEALDDASIEELEAVLISADLGVKATDSLINEVKEEAKVSGEMGRDKLLAVLKQKLLSILESNAENSQSIVPVMRNDGPLVIMVVGVNGVGKTTTTAKLAAQWKDEGAKVLLVAADTFRAGAVEQLQRWGEKIGIPVATGAAEAKPATVVFDAMERAKSEEFDVVLIDTAGRLHTKTSLMQELEGLRNTLQRFQPSAPHETLLVLDGCTGQNALSQATEFNDATPLTGIIVTKLDGTPKGGIVVAIKSEFGIPVRYIGVGEGVNDLRTFVPRDFVEAIFDSAEEQVVNNSAHAETRRRKRRDALEAA